MDVDLDIEALLPLVGKVAVFLRRRDRDEFERVVERHRKLLFLRGKGRRGCGNRAAACRASGACSSHFP